MVPDLASRDQTVISDRRESRTPKIAVGTTRNTQAPAYRRVVSVIQAMNKRAVAVDVMTVIAISDISTMDDA